MTRFTKFVVFVPLVVIVNHSKKEYLVGIIALSPKKAAPGAKAFNMA
jgi:hypothetical protein